MLAGRYLREASKPDRVGCVSWIVSVAVICFMNAQIGT